MPRAKTQKDATNSKTATSKKVIKKPTKPVMKVTKNLKPVLKVKKLQKGGHVDEEEVPGKRYFKCIMINKEGAAICSGRYSGKKPKQAASKACTRLFDAYKKSGHDIPEKIIFGMHECSRASKKKKKYFYFGARVQLDDPEEVEIDKIDPKTGENMVIRYNYNNNVKKLTNIEDCNEYKLLSNYDVKDEEEQDGGINNVKVVKKGKNASKKTSAKNKKVDKKTADKKVVKKTADKKVVKKTSVKKTSAKKSPAKKVVVKKTVAKKDSPVKKQIKVVNKNTKKVASTIKPTRKPSPKKVQK